ncbi:helix-turn-helix domain-containing protein [Leisingera methylohalidivorans]|uniref:helix-turn-helix domain-containing protein n=1 Tax=Leisingera methylohalidivorans TaxID=133924 RepID=UPI0018D2CC2C|nr:LysR family transcriptional regulator [Leisingera methylohalidivorans]
MQPVALSAFDLVVRHGNFTGTAEALGLAQSAVSQKIKGLETELGIAGERYKNYISFNNYGMVIQSGYPAMALPWAGWG